VQPITDWLEKLGMSEYAQRFAESRIDFSVLRDLTDQDLKELGVVLSDRRKLLRAIAANKAFASHSPKSEDLAKFAQGPSFEEPRRCLPPHTTSRHILAISASTRISRDVRFVPPTEVALLSNTSSAPHQNHRASA
jgi:SAM (Sterile alpha motif) domain-containing protein